MTASGILLRQTNALGMVLRHQGSTVTIGVDAGSVTLPLLAALVGARGPAATNLVASVNGQQGAVVLAAADVGALPATAITGGHAVAGPVAFAEVVITSSGDLDDPPLGTPRVVVDNTSLQHVVVSGDYTYQCATNAYGLSTSAIIEYVDGSTYSRYAQVDANYVTVGAVTFDDAGSPQYGNTAKIADGGFIFTTISPDGQRTQRLVVADLTGFEPGTGVDLNLQTTSGTLALAEEVLPADGNLAVRYDATQPEQDCLWVSPTGQIVLITGSP